MEDVGTHVSGRPFRGDGLYPRKACAETLARQPEIKILLHTKKKFGATAHELCKPQRHVGGNGTLAAQHRMQSLATDAYPTRRIGHGQAGVLFDDLTHQLTRMSWWPGLIADRKLTHMRL